MRAGYLILLLKKLFDKLPRSLEGIKSILLYPVFGILLMGLLIQLIINPPVAWLNEALYGLLARLGTGSRVLLGVLLGGMMSVDMGGPINKAAYVFGTASLASDEFQIMAAVMAGGMVPPLALALAVFAFRDKFSEKERQSGVANLIMGACFITEGAIPFAAADPPARSACLHYRLCGGRGIEHVFWLRTARTAWRHFRSARHQSSLRLSGSGYSGGVGRDAPAWRFEKKN